MSLVLGSSDLKQSREKNSLWLPAIWAKNPFFPIFIIAMLVVGFSLPEATPRMSKREIVTLYQKNISQIRQEPGKPSSRPWDYFHPTWIKESPWTFYKSSPSNDFSGAFSDSSFLINDPKNKIEREFLPPSDLRGRVQFWIDVYSKYTSRMRIIHDKRHPEVSFGYIDFRPLFRQSNSIVAAEIKSAQFEKAIIKQLKARLDEAAGISKTHLLSSEEKTAIQSFLSRNGALDKASYQRLLKNIRTQTGQKDVFLLALKRSKHLLPHIESVFKQQGLPVALARIPFVESSFNTRAQSKIGAVGIWQFTPDTARELIHADASHLWGDPLKQTRSAAKLLRAYRSVLPDWGTAITSYNSGVGRVRRIIQKYKVKNIARMVDLSHSDTLGFAGKNFYSEFLAANFVEAYKEQLFGDLLSATDSMLVFKENGAVPREYCDL